MDVIREDFFALLAEDGHRALQAIAAGARGCVSAVVAELDKPCRLS